MKLHEFWKSVRCGLLVHSVCNNVTIVSHKFCLNVTKVLHCDKHEAL